MPERPSVRPSVRLELSSLLILWMHALFFHVFLLSVETYLLGSTKLSLLSLMVKEFTYLADKGPYISPYFAFFVENHLLGNTKLSFLDL